MNKTKEAIFQSAIKIFSIHGFNGATMDDIAQNAGVAKGTLYYHFKSKEEIFNFIIKHGLQIIKEETISQVDQEDEVVDKLRVFFRTQLNLVSKYKDFLKVVISQLWGENTRHLELRNEMFGYAKVLEGYVNMAKNNHLIKNDNTFLLSCSILGAVCSLAIHESIKSESTIDNNENGDIDNSIMKEFETNKLIEYLLEGIGIKQNEKK